MATPYWGQLPGPKVNKHRRMSEDDAGPNSSALVDPNHGFDPNPRPAANRASGQTVASGTTLTPLASPTNSSVAPYGLAPRPPSYQRPLIVPEDPEPSARPPMKQDWKASGGIDDISNAPPVSFRQPHEDRDTARVAEMDYAGNQEVYNNGGSYGSSKMPMAADHSRRASAGASGRRRKSALTKSPLQKLELTLDSMTKEEKRARVEAAEKRARSRQQRAAGVEPFQEPEPAIQEPVAHARKPSVTYSDSRAAPVSVPGPAHRHQPGPRDDANRHIPAANVPARRHYLEGSERDPVQQSQQATKSRVPAHVPSEEPFEPALPQRNLSFRERTARDDIHLLPERDAQQPRQQAQPSSGFSLIRSGSNKLRKEPPGDPWARSSAEAEQLGAEPRRREDASLPRKAPPSAVSAQGHLPQRFRDKQLPPEPQDFKRHATVTAPRNAVPAYEDQPLQSVQRRATEPSHKRQQDDASYFPPVARPEVFKMRGQPHEDPITPQYAAGRRKLEREDDPADGEPRQHRISNMLYRDRQDMGPGDGLYLPPQWLTEWQRAPVGQLAGSALNLIKKKPSSQDQNKAWWEGGRSNGTSQSKHHKTETTEPEHNDLNGPTRFRPPLYLECGPLLRYCGIETEKAGPVVSRGATDRELWRGSVMIVTRDSESSYEIPPILRFFLQDLELLPAAPHHINGELSPEYVDPIAGHPKTGRRGETLFVRPVDHLEEGRDLSHIETDDGLFETSRSAPDMMPGDDSSDYPGSFASRMKRAEMDGEKLGKFAEVKGFRLHAERGCTFWRFNIEVELRERQQRIAYRINKGPSNAFWVPARGHSMNTMFHSCNGFSLDANPDALSGPDPMWRDVLNNHQTTPFHVMVGGGDQIYNDDVAEECDLFIDWLEIRNPLNKHNAPLTPELQAQLEDFYFRRYCRWFSMGLFGLANSQIPMVNIWSDRESFDGFGSYPHRDMNSPVLSGLGAVAFKYYMLFQHQSIIPETEETEPSWILGSEPGPYVNEKSRSVYVSLGSKLALLAADCRTERTEDDVIKDDTWEKIMNRLYAEVRRGHVEHLLVVLPIPIAYPRLEWLENILTSRALGPVKALGRRGLLGNALNKIDSGSEVMDDLRDHWTAKNHKHERSIVVEDLQDLAIDKSLRVTILSGDVNMAAVGQFYSNAKLKLPKHKDPRYMPNIISSAIANAPPPDIMADALNKRDKIHHFDKQTDESMIPLFHHGVDGKARNNKRLLPHRNWCSIRQWVPGTTPPPTPPLLAADSPANEAPGGGGGLLRRLSLSGGVRPDTPKESVDRSRPPVAGGGLLRTISRRLSRSGSQDGVRPKKLVRTMSLDREQGGAAQPAEKRGLFGFGRRGSLRRPDDGGINGQWGDDEPRQSQEYWEEEPLPQKRGLFSSIGLRGGGLDDEYSDGDESRFTAQPPRRAQTMPMGAQRTEGEIPPQALRQFHRTPTGLSTKQLRKPGNHEIDLEGGLDICLNVEVNPRDPTGITVPYRLLVPKLFYEYSPEDEEDGPVEEPATGGAFKRLLSFKKKERPVGAVPLQDERDEDIDARDDRFFEQRR
ncbi:uncharacterized protein F5Z01DRAFT_615628 [Emericellopsis atlantica]|uniref:PhoD-like phosphatase domain-containing protein n=1 Tax=Emericellopsis atlantica TaxID=2614577 RepID=A0A9P7ZUX5_9HYPO|nr:uncharacterized protein F5Z01DRAFT_615628 [Emericellopsis atlantica]KAG9258155.1 hypothetical protein F5Z01DRAFT_615628 [Emericellopsis atlantica]